MDLDRRAVERDDFDLDSGDPQALDSLENPVQNAFFRPSVHPHVNRVPVAESREMYKKLIQLGRPATYLELEGQGHGFKGEARFTYYKELFKFLEKVE